MIDEQRVQRWANRLGEEIPGAVAVFLVGSQLTGDAGPHSDLDFNALVERAVEDSPSPFDAEDDRLLRVSVWIRELADWWSDQGERQEWAFGLAVSEQVRLCWAADESGRRRLPPGDRYDRVADLGGGQVHTAADLRSRGTALADGSLRRHVGQLVSSADESG